MGPSSATAKGRSEPPRGTVCLEGCRRATELILARTSNAIRDSNVSRYAVVEAVYVSLTSILSYEDRPMRLEELLVFRPGPPLPFDWFFEHSVSL